MIGEGEIIHYMGDVVAGVVAETEALARSAAELIRVRYEVLEAVTDMHEAIKPDSIRVNDERSNVLETCSIRSGDVEKVFSEAAWVASGIYETQRIEHAFLETETAIATPGERRHQVIQPGTGRLCRQDSCSICTRTAGG